MSELNNDSLAAGVLPADRLPQPEKYKLIEYRVRPVLRFVVTRYHEYATGRGAGSDQIGEYDSADTAYQIGYALAKRDHDEQGWPIADMRIKYPENPPKYRIEGDEPQEVISLSYLKEALAAGKGPLQLLPNATPTGVASAIDAFVSTYGEKPSLMLLSAADWLKLSASEGFDNYFDPSTRFDTLRLGRVGHMFGTTVFTDNFQSVDQRWLENSCLVK